MFDFCRYYISAHVYLSAHSIITKNNTTPCNDNYNQACVHKLYRLTVQI